MDRRTAFGKRLRTIRDGCGYSQERLAELACLHRTYIGGVERGERNVSLMNIWRIADALKVHPSAFFAPPDAVVASGQARSRDSTSAGKPLRLKDVPWTKKRK
ncbi:MAG: helix-turn-helix transcriptional regulator [Candidatus Korobacteraceae bacterium]